MVWPGAGANVKSVVMSLYVPSIQQYYTAKQPGAILLKRTRLVLALIFKMTYGTSTQLGGYQHDYEALTIGKQDGEADKHDRDHSH